MASRCRSSMDKLVAGLVQRKTLHTFSCSGSNIWEKWYLERS